MSCQFSLSEVTFPENPEMFILKDAHPLVRRELNRIRAVERAEKQKPENQGRQVEYNGESRCLYVDGVVVDRFKPAFF